MPTIKRFEDLECWVAGRTLKRAVYRLTRKPEFTQDYPLISQVRRASFSVTANIVEGFERNGNREFVHFLTIAKGSAGEIRTTSTPRSTKATLPKTNFRKHTPWPNPPAGSSAVS